MNHSAGGRSATDTSQYPRLSGKRTWSTGESLTNIETQRGLKATPDAELQQLLHTMSCLDAPTVALIPPGRLIFRDDEALLEDDQDSKQPRWVHTSARPG